MIEKLMGKGTGGNPKRDDWNVAKTIGIPADQLEAVRRNVDAFLAPHRGTPREVAIRRFEVAKRTGGLSEDEALEVLQARECALRDDAECLPIALNADLPYHITGNPNCETRCNHPDCHDRSFRNAVCFDDASPCKTGIDMPKSRGIQMNHIREMRDRELVRVSGSKYRLEPEMEEQLPSNIKVKLARLRDIPQTFDLTTPADTPEELKAMWPEDLPKE